MSYKEYVSVVFFDDLITIKDFDSMKDAETYIDSLNKQYNTYIILRGFF